jgi:hypothetical protein
MSSSGKGGCLCQRWYSDDFASYLYRGPAKGCLRCQVAMVSCSVRSVAAASVIDPDPDCERRHGVQRWISAGCGTTLLKKPVRSQGIEIGQGPSSFGGELHQSRRDPARSLFIIPNNLVVVAAL